MKLKEPIFSRGREIKTTRQLMKEIRRAKKSNLSEYFKQDYQKITYSYCSRWVQTDSTHAPRQYVSACHSRAFCGGVTCVINYIDFDFKKEGLTRKDLNTYYRWLIHESPFASVFLVPFESVVQTKWLPVSGYAPFSLSQSANILARLPYERPERVKDMTTLMHKGMKGNDAYIAELLFTRECPYSWTYNKLLVGTHSNPLENVTKELLKDWRASNLHVDNRNSSSCFYKRGNKVTASSIFRSYLGTPLFAGKTDSDLLYERIGYVEEQHPFYKSKKYKKVNRLKTKDLVKIMPKVFDEICEG